MALLLAPVLLPIGVAVAIAVKLSSAGPVLYWSQRIGADHRMFAMPKFRTMRIGTPAVATHLLADPRSVLTPIGSFLRTTSLDEIPQLWSVLAGDMSFVGPRPALFNQQDLMELRDEVGVSRLIPGITGWAQINGRDDLPIPAKVALDREYLERRSFFFDLIIIIRTARKMLGDNSVTH